MESIKLQRVTQDDWEKLEQLEKGAASKTFHPITGEEEIKEFIESDNVYFVMLDGQIAGVVAYQDKKDSYYISDATIDPNFQGRGLAKLAIGKMMKEAGNDKPFTLVTHPENSKAICIYLKLGFKIKDWLPNHFGDGEARIYLVKDNE